MDTGKEKKKNQSGRETVLENVSKHKRGSTRLSIEMGQLPVLRFPYAFYLTGIVKSCGESQDSDLFLFLN